ncbi:MULTISPECIES: Crp/Fnr family transcriptional regulator [Olivibacter]|uniref:Crp/Fnr family transcriptional regulator n=1 Tax=Olivibacter TaxID=376469 RepID=UPI000411FD27|nr:MULTISPECIES: cyclic nucleotide-binding domain-containing protein [Olivibacter]
MTNKITDTLLEYVEFTPKELEIISSKFERQTILKNELFIREGNMCNKIAFVESGALILSQASESGKEQVLDFFTSGNMMSDYYSFLKNIPSEVNIKALKSSSVVIISKIDIEQLFEEIPNFQKLGRLLAEKYFIEQVEKLKYGVLTPHNR